MARSERERGRERERESRLDYFTLPHQEVEAAVRLSADRLLRACVRAESEKRDETQIEEEEEAEEQGGGGGVEEEEEEAVRVQDEQEKEEEVVVQEQKEEDQQQVQKEEEVQQQQQQQQKDQDQGHEQADSVATAPQAPPAPAPARVVTGGCKGPGAVLRLLGAQMLATEELLHPRYASLVRTTIVAAEYLPALREICAAEALRKCDIQGCSGEKDKSARSLRSTSRRFTHHLSGSVGEAVLETLECLPFRAPAAAPWP